MLIVHRHSEAQHAPLEGEREVQAKNRRPGKYCAWYKMLGLGGRKSKHIDFTFSMYQALSWAVSSLFKDRTDDCLCLCISRLWRRSMSLLHLPSPERVSFSLGLLIFDLPHPPTSQRLLFSYWTKNYMHYFIECTISLNKYNINIMFPFGPEILY